MGGVFDWEPCKIKNIAQVIGGGTPSTKISNYWDGSINWYSPTEIGKANYISESHKKITEDGLKHSSAKLLPGNKTILFTSRAGIGDMAIMTTDGATNQGFQSWVINTDKTNIYFLYSMGNSIKHQALRKASGSTFLEISNKEVKKLDIIIPKKLEQDKIGNLISQIDKTLLTQQRKVEQLKLLKKGLLQKMFAEENSKIPEIRFKGFDEEWKKNYLGNIFSERKEKNTNNDNLRLLSVSINNGLYPFDDSKRKDNSSKNKRNYKIVQKDDLVYNSMRMWQGACGVSNYKGIVSPAYTVLITKNNQLPEFYYYLFKKKIPNLFLEDTLKD